jgi:hypothetical protein
VVHSSGTFLALNSRRTCDAENALAAAIVEPTFASSAAIARSERVFPLFGERRASRLAFRINFGLSLRSPFDPLRRPWVADSQSRAPLSLATRFAFSNSLTAPKYLVNHFWQILGRPMFCSWRRSGELPDLLGVAGVAPVNSMSRISFVASLLATTS